MRINYFTGLFLASLLFSNSFSAQNLKKINEFLDTRISENKENADTSFYKLEGKKFYFFEKSEDGQNEIRKIIEFLPNSAIQLVDVNEQLKTGEITSHIYTGNLIRKKNFLSIYANKENGKKVALAPVYNLVLQLKDGIWYLFNINNNQEWMEGNTAPQNNKTAL